MKERINDLIEVLRIKKKRDINGNFYYSTTQGKIYSKHELHALIRRILGIDKQCYECGHYKFDYDLRIVEGTNSLICEQCIDDIIGGRKKINKHD